MKILKFWEWTMWEHAISWFGIIVLVLVGIAIIALLIQNRAKIAGWFAGGSWKTALWLVGGIALIAITALGIYLGHWNAWWNKITAWPYWLYVFIAIPVLVALILSARSGARVGDGLKKFFELLIAFAKLAVLLAITGVLFIFIVGPSKFWGQPMVIQQVPAQGATGGITTQAGATYDPKRIDVVAPIGTLATPLEKWSAPLNLYGRRSHMDAFSDDGMRREGVLAVYADGIIHIIGPGLNPDIGKPNTLRFLSLTNFPLRISGTIE